LGELEQTIAQVKPDKIGINVLNVKYKSALYIIEVAQSYNIPVIVGGITQVQNQIPILKVWKSFAGV